MMTSHLRSFSLSLLMSRACCRPLGRSDTAIISEPSGRAFPGTAAARRHVGTCRWANQRDDRAEDAPVLVSWASARRTHSLAAATQVARTQARSLDAAQQLLLPQIAQAGGQVLYRLQRTLERYRRLCAARPDRRAAAPPGCARDPPADPQGALITATSVPLIGAPQLWGAAVPVRGEGIKVGVIDTGIDYLHTDFGGSGRAADYARNHTDCDHRQ